MRLFPSTAIAAAFLVTALLPAQGAAVTLYGSACRDAANSVPAPVMFVSGHPQLGNQITLRYLGPNSADSFSSSRPVLITGLSSANAPVPRLSGEMSSGCTLLVDAVVAAVVMPLGAGAGYEDRVRYTIPNNYSVLGATVYHQWATLVRSNVGSGWTFRYLMLSNAARVYVGL